MLTLSSRREEATYREGPSGGLSAAAEAEARLVAGIRAGDAGACERLVGQYGDRMLAVARRYLHCDADSADAVQDALLAAFQAIDSFAGQARLWTWLYRILVNTCLMRLRSRARNRSVSLDDLLPALEEADRPGCALAQVSEQAYALATRAELRAHVRACIDRLPAAYRTVVLLRDIEELDTDETAERLHTSPGAVKTRLHRARQALRVLLEPLLSAEAGLSGDLALSPLG